MNQIDVVMISSTSMDLKPHREEARDACLLLGMLPKMMEYLPSMGVDAVKASMEMVDTADVYVGIIAHRYGFIPEGYDQSITEMEYDRAVKRGIPRLIFVIDDAHPPLENPTEDPEHADRLADFRERLLADNIVSFYTSASDLRARIVFSLTQLDPTPQTFSESISDQLADFHQRVASLTEEQYTILNFLRGHRRVAIAGCAGSGKTLVAAEKAIRLAADGVRTLFLCHNPYLAEYVRELVLGAAVDVLDISTWVHALIGDVQDEGAGWSYYEEPTEAMMSRAFDRLTEAETRYEAIIIDEGQDFRDEWWLLVEAALSDPETGILYVFHDDNQALVPRSLKYPIVDAPYTLSVNCRNAGDIFDLVRDLHPDAPQTSLHLASKGVVNYRRFVSGGELDAVRSAIEEAATILAEDQLVVLTTEPDPVSGSMLNGLQVAMALDWRWQDVLQRELTYLGARFGLHRQTPTLSEAAFPTAEDIRTVNEFATAISRTPIAVQQGKVSPVKVQKVRWLETSDSVRLARTSSLTKVHFFMQDSWADTLPRPDLLTVRAGIEPDEFGAIPLLTIPSFKGLEADGVILFVLSPRDDLAASLYVGISRARFLLHVVLHNDVKHQYLSYIPRTPEHVVDQVRLAQGRRG